MASVRKTEGQLTTSGKPNPAADLLVRLVLMRFVHSILALVCSGLIVSCAHRASTPSANTRGFVVLDNHGGYSHPGRRIDLRPDDNYTDIRYTDVVGQQKVDCGLYTFDAKKRRLTLAPTHGEVEHLYLVDYGSQQYWVPEKDRQRIMDPAEAWFRQISLRAETR